MIGDSPKSAAERAKEMEDRIKQMLDLTDVNSRASVKIVENPETVDIIIKSIDLEELSSSPQFKSFKRLYDLYFQDPITQSGSVGARRQSILSLWKAVYETMASPEALEKYQSLLYEQNYNDVIYMNPQDVKEPTSLQNFLQQNRALYSYLPLPWAIKCKVFEDEGQWTTCITFTPPLDESYANRLLNPLRERGGFDECELVPSIDGSHNTLLVSGNKDDVIRYYMGDLFANKTEVGKKVIDPQTGNAKTDPETGKVQTESLTHTDEEWRAISNNLNFFSMLVRPLLNEADSRESKESFDHYRDTQLLKTQSMLEETRQKYFGNEKKWEKTHRPKPAIREHQPQVPHSVLNANETGVPQKKQTPSTTEPGKPRKKVDFK